MDERQRELLKRLETFFSEDEDIEEASLFTKEELNAPVDVLRVLALDYGPRLMDLLAEFSFLPLGEEQEIFYFSSVLTISMNVPKEGIPALAGAISRLNFYLPFGAFCLSQDGSMLIFKTAVPMAAGQSDDAIYQAMEIAADASILIPESYTDLLLRIAEGNLLLDDFIATLPE